MFGRPAYSDTFDQDVFHTGPELEVLQWNGFDELLHTFNEPFHHGRLSYQPVHLNATSQNREEGDTPNDIPISELEIFELDLLFSATDTLFNGARSQTSSDNLFNRLLCSNGEVSMQHHVIIKPDNDNHIELSGSILVSCGNAVELNGPLFYHMAFFVHIRDHSFDGLSQARSQLAYQNSGTAFEHNVLYLEKSAVFFICYQLSLIKTMIRSTVRNGKLQTI